MAILWSAPARVYSRDVDYEYRQDSDLLYLTGIEQPDTILVLLPGSRRRKEILFTTPPNPRREHYVGRFLSAEEARSRTGIDTVFSTAEFDAFLAAVFDRRPYGLSVDDSRDNDDHDSFFRALDEGTAKLALRLESPPGMSEPLTDEYIFANRARERLVGASIMNLAPAVHGLRQVKTAYEQKVLIESVDISSEAHLAGMRAARPERYEREVESAIEGIYLARGAMSPGYPSIVGSGPNATVLHYSASSRRMKEGDLLLVDAAANYKGQTGDITRTYPASGRFTPQQREIYELVLAAQDAAMKAAKIGARTVDIERAAEVVDQAGTAQAQSHHRRQRTAVPDVVHAWHLPLDRDGRPRRRRLPAAARGRHGVRHRAGAVHPAGSPRSTTGHAGEPRVSRKGDAGRRTLQRDWRPHRGLVSPDGQGTRPTVREGAAHDSGDRRLHAQPSLSAATRSLSRVRPDISPKGACRPRRPSSRPSARAPTAVA